jgi:hypothetical protein
MVVLLVVRELITAISGRYMGLHLISELFWENFLRGEKWKTSFSHSGKGSPKVTG